MAEITTADDLAAFWATVLGEVELNLSKANFDTWLRSTKCIGFDGSLCTIGVSNGFTKARIETKYQPLLERIASKHIGFPIRMICQVVSSDKPQNVPTNGLFAHPQTQNGYPQAVDNIRPVLNGTNGNGLGNGSLNTAFTFEHFVVGSSNKLAHAAAVAVAENPGSSYNPLFLYGGVGLGKTHLMHAISLEVKQKYPEKKILYVSSEKFTNELITSIRTNQTEAFRQKYRTVDVLLIDDIQFIAGKETTQEEFFHTFNAVYEAGGQIVLSSDRPPTAIPTLEDRLQSRFVAGLIADIQQPDYETRVAILTGKSQQRHLHVPGDVINYIAVHVESNIRELEGALNRVVSHCRVHDLPITEDIAANVLNMFVHKPIERKVSLPRIIEKVSDYYNIEKDVIMGRSRKKEYVMPRQIAMYLMREKADASLNQIGAEFGGKDHTTVLHACQKIEGLLEHDSDLQKEIYELERRLFV